MFEYTGTIEVITDTHTMDVTPLNFIFNHTHVLTERDVKEQAINHLHEQVVVYGVSGITYKWRVL
jgi:hypothetical protein